MSLDLDAFGHDTFGDALRPFRDDVPEAFFDRFVFSVHPWDAATPTLHIGFGAHPARGVADGLVLTVLPDEQRNYRYSTTLASVTESPAGLTVDAFSFEVVSPMREWALTLGPNESGVEFDLTWTARTSPWSGTVAVPNETATPTSFDHLFQSGTYTGWISVDGVRTTADGWVGARDRSRGVRTMRGGQGLHLWVLAHLPSATIGAMLVEDRQGGLILCEGGVLGVDGSVTPIDSVQHALVFDDMFDLASARLRVRAGSSTYDLDADTSARGGYMAGGGYGDHHGESHGEGHHEFDVYRLDGTVGPRTLDSALTDRTTLFTAAAPGGAERGVGIFEFARTRSPRYEYRPTLES
jgi:hypothetical protein